MANNAPQKTTGISVESLDHISIAVPDLAQAIDLYREKFGCVVSNPMELPEQGIRIAYVGLENAKLELMEPLGSSSPLSKFLESHPAGGLPTGNTAEQLRGPGQAGFPAAWGHPCCEESQDPVPLHSVRSCDKGHNAARREPSPPCRHPPA